jgi:hypothetical protein
VMAVCGNCGTSQCCGMRMRERRQRTQWINTWPFLEVLHFQCQPDEASLSACPDPSSHVCQPAAFKLSDHDQVTASGQQSAQVHINDSRVVTHSQSTQRGGSTSRPGWRAPHGTELGTVHMELWSIRESGVIHSPTMTLHCTISIQTARFKATVKMHACPWHWADPAHGTLRWA